MRLTSFSDYAFRLLIFAASHGDRLVTIEEAARKFAISRAHLMKVANELTRAGFLKAVRGRSGGLTLGRPAEEIRLVRGSVYEMEFEPGAFDFIYSLGVFGYGAAVTPELCARLHRWLAPGGWIYFDAIEIPHRATRKDRLRERIYPLLPASVRHRLDARQAVPVVRHTREAVRAAMIAAGFSDLVLASNHCRSPLWNGVHLECSGGKPGAATTTAAGRAAMQLEFAEAG